MSCNKYGIRIRDGYGDISQCPNCLCMTYTIKGKCGKCKKPKCDCHLHERQVCDVCQGIVEKHPKDKKPKKGKSNMGFGKRPYKKEFRYSSTRRHELLKLLKKYWSRHDNLRLGQLIQNLFPDVDLFYLEDSKLFDMLKQRVNIKIQKEFLE